MQIFRNIRYPNLVHVQNMKTRHVARVFKRLKMQFITIDHRCSVLMVKHAVKKKKKKKKKKEKEQTSI